MKMKPNVNACAVIKKLVHRGRSGLRASSSGSGSVSRSTNTNTNSSHQPGTRHSLKAIVNPLECLAQVGLWESFEQRLNESECYFVGPIFSYGDSMLHMVCRHHPSVRVVQRVLSDRAPRLAVKEVNKAGQTPLHVAAACGASSRVVRLLLKQCPDSATSQDLQGNTPLHLHFTNTCGQKVCDSGFHIPKLSSSPSSVQSAPYSHLSSSVHGSYVGKMISNNSIRSTASTAALSIASLVRASSNALSVSNHGGSSDRKKASSKLLRRSDSVPKIDSDGGRFKEDHSVCSRETVGQLKMLLLGPSQEVVHELAKASPSCLVVENDEDLSVVELAIMHEADLKTVTKLQEILRCHLKSKQQSQSQISHCGIAKSIPEGKILQNAAA
jgi:hypothetical protein